MHLEDVLNLLAAVDYELQELEKRRAVAQSEADASEIWQLDAEIKRLVRRKAELRQRWARERGGR